MSTADGGMKSNTTPKVQTQLLILQRNLLLRLLQRLRGPKQIRNPINFEILMMSIIGLKDFASFNQLHQFHQFHQFHEIYVSSIISYASCGVACFTVGRYNVLGI